MRKTRRKFLTHDVAMGATILALAMATDSGEQK
jgi:hypothetical protein